MEIKGQSHNENRQKSSQVILITDPSILPKWKKSEKLLGSYRMKKVCGRRRRRRRANWNKNFQSPPVYRGDLKTYCSFVRILPKDVLTMNSWLSWSYKGVAKHQPSECVWWDYNSITMASSTSDYICIRPLFYLHSDNIIIWGHCKKLHWACLYAKSRGQNTWQK